MYKTRTYLAGAWTEDSDLIQTIKKWHDSDYWSLDYSDAHKLKQARDTSLSCSIKASLMKRLDASKTFILIVGEATDNLTRGSCQYCENYYYRICLRGRNIDTRSFIEYECEKAIAYDMNIIVIYNSTNIDKSLCPDCFKKLGNHIAAKKILADGKEYWNYDEIRDAINLANGKY